MKTLKNLNEASEQNLACREVGHCWTFKTDGSITTGHGNTVIEFTRTLNCIRCGAHKSMVIDVTNLTVKRVRVSYPDNYLMAKGVRVTRRDVRREAINRIAQFRASTN